MQKVLVPEEYLSLITQVDLKQAEPIIKKLMDIGTGIDVPKKLKAFFGINIPKDAIQEVRKICTTHYETIFEADNSEGSDKSNKKTPIFTLLLGGAIVLSAFLYLLYKKRKKLYGSLYNLGTLLKEVGAWLFTSIGKVLTDLLKQIYKIVITIFAVTIVALIAYHLTKNINEEEILSKYPKMGHIFIFLKRVIQKVTISFKDVPNPPTKSNNTTNPTSPNPGSNTNTNGPNIIPTSQRTVQANLKTAQTNSPTNSKPKNINPIPPSEQNSSEKKTKTKPTPNVPPPNKKRREPKKNPDKYEQNSQNNKQGKKRKTPDKYEQDAENNNKRKNRKNPENKKKI